MHGLAALGSRNRCTSGCARPSSMAPGGVAEPPVIAVDSRWYRVGAVLVIAWFGVASLLFVSRCASPSPSLLSVLRSDLHSLYRPATARQGGTPPQWDLYRRAQDVHDDPAPRRRKHRVPVPLARVLAPDLAQQVSASRQIGSTLEHRRARFVLDVLVRLSAWPTGLTSARLTRNLLPPAVPTGSS